MPFTPDYSELAFLSFGTKYSNIQGKKIQEVRKFVGTNITQCTKCLHLRNMYLKTTNSFKFPAVIRTLIFKKKQTTLTTTTTKNVPTAREHIYNSS